MMTEKLPSGHLVVSMFDVHSEKGEFHALAFAFQMQLHHLSPEAFVDQHFATQTPTYMKNSQNHSNEINCCNLGLQ